MYCNAFELSFPVRSAEPSKPFVIREPLLLLETMLNYLQSNYAFQPIIIWPVTKRVSVNLAITKLVSSRINKTLKVMEHTEEKSNFRKRKLIKIYSS